MTQSPQEIVIPSGAGRRFFFPSRSCELVGLRSEDRFLFARFLREESLSPFAFACVGVVLQRDPFLTENLLTRNLLMERAHPTRRIGVCGRVAQA